MRSVREVMWVMTGVWPRVERTGGNCEALVCDMPDGGHVVACSDLQVPEWGSEDTSTGRYEPGAWENGGDATHNGWSDEQLTPEVFERLLRDVTGEE